MEQASGLLLAELGQQYCTVAQIPEGSQNVSGLRMVGWDGPSIPAEELVEVLSFPGSRFDRVVICSAFPQSTLVPHKYFHSVAAADPLFSADGKQLYDTVPEWQLMNIYYLPLAVYEGVSHLYPQAEYFHAYTPPLKIYNGFVAEDQVSVHVGPGEIRVVVRKGGRLELVQTYAYATSLDVVYFLLKICYEFQLPQGDVLLILSGLVAEDSALYRDLRQYFGNLHFSKPVSVGLDDTAHPQHYFASLYNLAACVL
jgi:hypothetical protein